MTKILIAVFLSGNADSLLRYCVQMVLHERIVPYSFPQVMFAIGITGSSLIGLFCALSAHFNLSTEVYMLLTTGLCGGFTTLSTLSNDGLILMKQGSYGLSAICTLLSALLGILAVLDESIIGRTF